MGKIKIYRFLFLILVVGAFSVFNATEIRAEGERAVLQDIVVANSSTRLLLYFQVANGFKKNMEVGVMNGIPITFTFFVSLYKVRTGWADHEEVALSFDHMLEYDNLKEEFIIHYGEKDGLLTRCKTIVEAKKMMAEVNGFALVGMDKLIGGEEYRLSVKARLARKTLPLYIHYLIPFWKLGDFETDWYEERLKY